MRRISVPLEPQLSIRLSFCWIEFLLRKKSKDIPFLFWEKIAGFLLLLNRRGGSVMSTIVKDMH